MVVVFKNGKESLEAIVSDDLAIIDFCRTGFQLQMEKTRQSHSVVSKLDRQKFVLAESNNIASHFDGLAVQIHRRQNMCTFLKHGLALSLDVCSGRNQLFTDYRGQPKFLLFDISKIGEHLLRAGIDSNLDTVFLFFTANEPDTRSRQQQSNAQQHQ